MVTALEEAIIGGVGEAAAAEETGGAGEASYTTRTMEPTIPLTCPALPCGACMTAVVEGANRARVASQASQVRAAREARVANRVNDSGEILGIESNVSNTCDMRRLVKIH